MPLITNILITAAVGIVILFLGFVIWYRWMTRSRRPKDAGYPYVMINDDGSAREVTAKEKEFIETEFDSADGAPLHQVSL